jgi:two-component system, OmpR family, response regulator MprA
VERATIDGRIAAPGTPHPLILVVDDHLDMREALAMVLRSEGYRAVTAIDGSEALDMVTREPPDLILLDYAMPGLDGAGFCLAYRQRGGEAPIVLMTAGLLVTLAEARAASAHCGAAALLPKPFEIDELLETITPSLPPRT